MDNEDREATPAEPSSSQLCETIDGIDGYLSGEAPSSDVIDSSHLFSSAFDEDENVEESHSKSPTSSPCLIPFGKTYNYNEAAIACQVDQSHFCEQPNVYSGASDSKQSGNNFNQIELDDNQPGPSSSGNLSAPSSERHDFQSDSSNSSFEPTSNENRDDSNYKLNYPVINFAQVSEASSRTYNPSSSKQADSSEFTGNKGPGKLKNSKGKGKGKMILKHNIHPKNSSIKNFKARENAVESTNKHSLFAVHSSRINNPLLEIENRVNQSGLANEVNEMEENPVNASSSSSHCEFSGQRNMQNLNEDEAYMVASSSGGMNCMDHIIDLKSPTTPGDSCLVSSSTGQLDSLPPTPVNFQGNDASHSSPASSPLNPPVLDSTVDSTSGQNLLSSPYSDENEIARSNDEIEFGCSLDEGRNEISTSVSHLHHGVDSQDLNLLVGGQSVFVGQQPNGSAHFVGPFISLNSLNSQSLHSTLTDEKTTAEAVSALIPTTSSAYLPDCLEMPGSSHMSDASKRLVYGRRKESTYRPPLGADNSSLGQSSAPLNNMSNHLSFTDENSLASCNPDGDLSHVGLMELRISEMEPESSNLVASSANLDNEEFPSASSAGAMSPSGNNFESGSTLAQLNQHYLLGIGENSLSSEDGLSPQSVSQTAPGLSEGALGLGQQLRETEESLESTSNFTDSLELGLGPQQLRRIMESRQEPQSLIPPPHLLEEAHNTDPASGGGHMDSAGTIMDSVNKSSESIPITVATGFTSTRQVSPLLPSETSSANSESSFVMVSEADVPHTTRFNSIVPHFNKMKSSTEKDLKHGHPSNIEIHLKSRNPFLEEPQNCPHMNSSLPDGSKSDEKNNPYRIGNGFLKSREREPSKGLEVASGGVPDSNQEEQPDDLFPARYEDRGSVLGAVSQTSVPVNIHSLFGHRPSILKPPTTAKPLSNFSYFTPKSGEMNHDALPDGGTIGEKSILSEDCAGGSTTSATTTTILNLSGRVDLSSPNNSGKNVMTDFNKEEFVQSEALLVEGARNNSSRQDDAEEEELMRDVTTDVHGHLNEDVSNASAEILLQGRETPHDGDRSVQSNEDLGHPNENEYWCGDCEMFLRTKCRMHRVQTIMDKPVLTRAWASLPAQHLTIKLVPTDKADSQERRNGVFARKSIPKRTQFGPLEGRFVMEVPPNVNLHFKTTIGGTEGYLDVSEEGFSNWMRFVRAADTFTQMNCVVIEEETFIYFLTTASIPPKTELRVGYSKQYAVKYNLHLLLPTEEEEKELLKSLTCNECNTTLSSQTELDEHVASHSRAEYSEGRPRRKARPKGFGNKQSSPPLVHSPRLVKRVKMNKRSDGSSDNNEASTQPNKKGRDSLECSYCDLCFNQSQLLRIHSLVHNNDTSASSEDMPRFSGADAAELSGFLPNYLTYTRTCPSCRKNCENIEELIEHTKDHSFVRQKDADEQQTFKCKLCYKSFGSKDRLIGHAESHKSDTEKPFACFHCFRRFCNKSALGSHLKLHSEGEGVKVYDCPICQEKFYTVSSLKTHLPSHCVNGEYTCPTCSKKFPSYHKIRRHIRSYHSAVHPCHECGKLLPSLEKLKVHLVSHSDRRDFACPMCQKCFKRKDKMKEHLKRIHTIKREPNNNTFNKKRTNPKFVPKVDPSDYKQFIYKCDLCLVGFKRRGMLVNHLSKRHPNIPLSSIPELNQPILRTSHSYFCQYCEKAYVSTTKRKLHIMKNHPGAELPPPRAPMGGGGEGGSKTTRTYAASCPWCPRQYATKAKLLQHQRHHHGRGSKDESHQQQAGASKGTKEQQQHPPPFLPEERVVEEDSPKEDILSQAFGRVSGKAHLVRVEPQGSQTVVELRVQPEGGRERTPAKGDPSSASVGEQVLMSPSLILPHDGAAYALLTPDGGDAFTFSLRSGQILPSVGGFSVLSTSAEAPVGPPDEGTEPGPSSRLLPLDANVPHSQFALELNGGKGESCVVTQVGPDTPSPVLVWQPSLSFAPSS